MTQEEMAEKIEVSRAALSHYESGRREPDMEILEKIATFFNCSIDYIMFRTNKRKWDTETIAFSTVSVDGLDEDEIEHIRGMIELLKRKHGK